MKKIFLFMNVFALLLSNQVDAYPLERAQAIANSVYWQRLLHYKRHWLGGWKSAVDGDAFFFSPKGKTDPYAELVATIEAFEKNIQIGKLKQHPQCAFPERFRFLTKELSLRIPAVSCERFEEYKKQFNASSVTLVFSSAYPSNPGSMFGHTFLRINAKNSMHKDAPQKLDLLDKGISYAAQVNESDNAFVFAWSGLFGGYDGVFSYMPYYQKVNEYNNSESRDLWEYELNLNEEETNRLLANVWELETNASFDYYFFDENCAYQLLTLLEVAKPEWNLSAYFVHFIPGESVKRVADIPSAVRSIKMRPSLRKKLFAKYNALSLEEKVTFHKLKKGEFLPNLNSKVLDTSLAYLYYEKQKDAGLTQEQEKNLQHLLIERSKISAEVWEGEAIAVSSRPDLAHHPYRTALSLGVRDTRSSGAWTTFSDLHFKFAYHDLLNSDDGFTPFSQINFPNVTIRYVPKENFLYLRELEIASLVALNPWTAVEKPITWRFSARYYEPRDFECNYCRVAHFDTGAGISFYPSTEKAIIYGLLLAEIEAGRALKKGFRYGPKINMGIIGQPAKKWKAQLEFYRFYDLGQKDRGSYYNQLQWNTAYAFNPAWDLRQEFGYLFHEDLNVENEQELKFSLSHYF